VLVASNAPDNARYEHETKIVDKHIFACCINFYENHAIYEIMWISVFRYTYVACLVNS
jgi:hypothetical protein